MALDTFRPCLFDQRIIHFVDNSSALGALVKGYSNNSDCFLKAATYIDRVGPKSNISDEPSRLCYDELMAELGAVWFPPVLDSLKKGPSQKGSLLVVRRCGPLEETARQPLAYLLGQRKIKARFHTFNERCAIWTHHRLVHITYYMVFRPSPRHTPDSPFCPDERIL